MYVQYYYEMKILHHSVIIICILSGIVIITNPSFAHGETNETRIGIQSPVWIDVNPNTNIAYVEHFDVTGRNGIISMIHGSINNIVTDIQITLPQTRIVVNPVTNMLYFGYTNVKDYIAVIDGSTSHVVNNIQIFQQAPQLAINPSTNKLYVTDFWNNTQIIDVIDGLTNSVTKIIIPSGVNTIEVNPDTNKLYLGARTGNQTGIVYEMDGFTNKIVNKITIPYDDVQGLMVNPRTNFLYVADGGPKSDCDACHNQCQNGFVHIIDLTTKKFVANSTVIAPASFSINPNTGKVYVSSGPYCRTVTVIDENSGKVLYAISNSTWTAVNPKTNKVYISHYFDNSISIVSDSGNRLVSPLQQFKSGIAPKDIKCASNLQLIIKTKNHTPVCIKPGDVSKLVERGWADKPNSLQEQLDMANSCTGMTDACRHRYDTNKNPFGITALIIYHPPDLCLNSPSHSVPSSMPSCPPNKFYLKINSNSTAYLMGYNICDGNSCATNNTLSIILPLNTGLNPDYQMIGLPVNLPWKYGDTVGIQLYVSSTGDNKTASLIDLGNSSIVP